MKQRLMNRIRCLLAIFLLLFGAIPCHAMTFEPPKIVGTIEELLAWYGGLSGNTPQECGVTEPIAITGEVVLGPTPCLVDITLLGGLRISAGARLIIDNPNVVLQGPPPVITIEPGGVLHVRRWNMLTAQAIPQGGILVQAGGTLLMEPGTTLPDGVVIDQNPPPNDLLPPSNGLLPPTTAPPPTPETPPAEEKLSITGGVYKVTAGGNLFALVTLPRVDPTRTQTIAIERSADAQAWDAEYVFRWDENSLGFKSDQVTEMGNMLARNHSDGKKTDFRYFAKLSGKPFYLRVILTATDGQQTVSNEIRLTEPPAGNHIENGDFDESGGNRGGGGQGTTDREEQKEIVVPLPDNVPAEPQITTRALAAMAGAEALPVAPQETALTAQDTVGQQTAPGIEKAILSTSVQPAEQSGQAISAQPTEQSGQAVSTQENPQGSSARNWMVITATLALCGAIWIFTTKRKKP